MDSGTANSWISCESVNIENLLRLDAKEEFVYTLSATALFAISEAIVLAIGPIATS